MDKKEKLINYMADYFGVNRPAIRVIAADEEINIFINISKEDIVGKYIITYTPDNLYMQMEGNRMLKDTEGIICGLKNMAISINMRLINELFAAIKKIYEEE